MSSLRFLVIGVIGYFLSTTTLSAQDTKAASTPNPPITLEASFGHEAMTYQLMINKKLRSVPKLGFFSITSLNKGWNQGKFDVMMTQALATYRVVKGLDLAAGFHYTDNTKLRPMTSLIYIYSKPELLLVASPRVDLIKNPVQENLIIAEYKPLLSEKVRLYTRLQGLYGFAPKTGAHARSYIVGRLGVTTGEFTYGLAANFDWFGPIKGYQENFGAFISVPLF